MQKALDLQINNPLHSEGAICGLLRVGRQYIADRAARNPAIKEVREVMAAIRQGAWEQLGQELITTPSQNLTPAVYIWMTRNLLQWRNDPTPQVSLPLYASEQPQVKSISSAEYLEVLRERMRNQNPKEEGKP